MVITTKQELQIGSVGRGLISNAENDPLFDMPYFVLRKATREEWVQDCIELGLPINVEPYEFFYEVSLD